MIKAIISDGIYLNFRQISRELRQKLVKKYTFQKLDYNQNIEKVNLASMEKVGDESFLKLPPNKSYFESIIEELQIEVEFEDKRSLYLPNKPLEASIIPRDYQQLMINDMEKFEYNCMVTARTNAGKTAMSIYLTKLLKTSMLFVASRTSLIENLTKDCVSFDVDKSQMTEINTKWLENPVITPIMYCTTQTLQNEAITKELYDKVGLLVADEIHLGILGKETRKALFSLNPKYRLYLSATPNKKGFEGLVECALSDNIVTNEEKINFDIQIHNLEINPCYSVKADYNSTDSYHEKKDALFQNEAITNTIAKMIGYYAKFKKRGVMIYLENKEGQEIIAEKLKWWGLKVGILNSNTKKKQQKHIIESFDSGEYDVLVGGTSMSAGLSFYRLSLILDLNITLNENNLEQLLGRLKRKDNKVSNNSKEFIKVTYKTLTERKWSRDRRCLKKFDYMKFTGKYHFNLDYGLDEIDENIVEVLREIPFGN